MSVRAIDRPREHQAAPEPGSGPLPGRVRIAIIGSGFAGLCAAIRLKQTGRDDFVVLERAGDVGGTWRDNSYPGCTCDVPSHLYSFSFAPNPDWSMSFSPQPEIQAYLRRCAREFGVLPHVRFDAEVLEARWEDASATWHLVTSRGDVEADVVIGATGPLSEPSTPSFPGLETFEGTTFHSAAWRHDHDLAGERVAAIGTGASAVQFIPHVQRVTSKLSVFQRTAPWVLPRWDRRFSRVERWLYRRFRPAQRLLRAGIYWGRESWILGFEKEPRIMAVAERMASLHLRRQVRDPELRAKLTPDFRLGCKRVLLSNDYYPALTQPNVEVVTDPIVEVTRRGVLTRGADGTTREHPVDTIIFGTGFHVTDPPIAERVTGRDGRTLMEHWSGGMSALHGLTVHGFPNLFFLIGPNTGLGHTSVVLMIEAQVRYLIDALRQMEDLDVATIEPRADVQAAYDERIQQRLAGTVWNTGGCASWYLDRNGRNTTLWPTFTFSFIRELRRCDLTEYVVERRTVGRPAVPA